MVETASARSNDARLVIEIPKSNQAISLGAIETHRSKVFLRAILIKNQLTSHAIEVQRRAVGCMEENNVPEVRLKRNDFTRPRSVMLNVSTRNVFDCTTLNG